MTNRCVRLLALLVIAAFVALSPPLGQSTAYAHGGVIIDGGFTDDYEWIAMASPFPVTPGETILTILIYDIETYAPINGLTPTLELARPSAPQPCCQDDTTLGPLPLVVDPVLYPGDYSNITLLLREGTWSGRFTIDESDPVGPGVHTEIFFEVDVKAAEEGVERPTPIDAEMIALTATAIAPTVGDGNSAVPTLAPSDVNSTTLTADSAYPAPETAVAGTSSQEGSDAEGSGDAASDQPQPAAQDAAAAGTPYPPPVVPAEPASESAAEPSGPSVQLPAEPSSNEFGTPTGGTERSWAVDNIWLLAALALVPILLVVFWLLLSGRNENEWTGDD